MSTALIVGGDYIEGIKQVLNSHGIGNIAHWPGARRATAKRSSRTIRG